MPRPLALLLAAYLALGLAYSLATPVFEASDEIWHYPVVREIAEHHRLPVQEPGVKTLWAQEGSQPPLYYALAALLTGWIDTADYDRTAILNPFPKIGVPGASDNINLVAHPPGQSPAHGGTVLAVHLIRWFSLLMGATTVYLTYRLATAIYPARPALALLSAALVAFNPMALFIAASVNNDNLVMLLTTLTLWLLVREMKAVEQDKRWGQTIRLGIIVGLAALTKVSGAVLAPIVALALLLSPSTPRNAQHAIRNTKYPPIWQRLAVFLLTASLVAGWWYLRNLRLYGELLGLQRMAQIAGPRPPGFSLIDLWPEWQGFWYSFWGVFGAFNLLAPRGFYLLVGGLTLLAGAGLLLLLSRKLVRGERITAWPIHLILITFLALTLLGVVRWTLLTTASQGRLLFGGIAPLALYLSLGLLAWVPQKRQHLATRMIALALAAIATLLPFRVIAPTYRPPAPLPALPADATPLDIRFGDDIQLVGYRLEAASTAPGQPLPFTLFWRTERPLDRFYQLSLNGFGYEQENIAKLDAWPGGGLLPTAYWRPGLLYPDPYRLSIDPAASAPTLLRLGVSYGTDLLHLPHNQPLPATIAGQPSGSVLLDAGALVDAVRLSAHDEALPTDQPPRPEPLVILAHGIHLQSYDIEPQEQRLAVTLTWVATEPIPADYQVFVHLLDPGGARVAQGDAPPANGYWPTSHWRPGEAILSHHLLPLPPGIDLNNYRLLVGMYDLVANERLPAFTPVQRHGQTLPGQPLTENALLLPLHD